MRRRRHAATPAAAARATTTPTPVRRGTGDPADGGRIAAGAASTILGVDRAAALADAGSPADVDDVVVGPGAVVEGAGVCAPRGPVAPVVDSPGVRVVVVGGPRPPAVDPPWGGDGTVLVVVTTDVVVVDPEPTPFVARTALGGNVGCPPAPMSVGPNVQASTLPAAGW